MRLALFCAALAVAGPAHAQNHCQLPQHAGGTGTTLTAGNYVARITVGQLVGMSSSGGLNLGVGLQSASIGGYVCFQSTNAPLAVAALSGSQSMQRLVATTARAMTLEWTPSEDILPVTYSVYAGTIPLALPLIVTGLTGTSFVLAPLDYLTPYYWRVETNDQFGRASFSDIYSFSIAPAIAHMIAAPNPFHPGNGSTTFEFMMSGPGSALLEVFSLPDSKRVFSTRLDGLQDGVNTYVYDGRESNGRLLPNGVYSVRLTKNGANGNAIERFKIVSVR